MWAQLQLDEICKQTSDKAIKKTLKRMPENLYATYKRILESIRGKGRGQYALARRLLICVAYSRSPIPVSLLRYAVSVEEDCESLEDLESSIPDEKVMVDACANLVSIDRGIVRFVHFSVQEFLTSNHSSIRAFGLEPTVAHREIARMLILLLNILASPEAQLESARAQAHSQPQKGFGVGNLRKHWDMLHEWQYHLLTGNMGELSVDHSMVTMVNSFFQQSPPLPIGESYLNDLEREHRRPSPVDLCFSPSALALLFGLPGIYQQYHLKTDYITPCSSKRKPGRALICFRNRFGSHKIAFGDHFAVHYAVAVLDSAPIVQRLYDHGYPIDLSCTENSVIQPHYMDGDVHWWNMPYIYQLSPLYSARSERMARLLLGNGASTDPQLKNKLYDPLTWFAKAGNTKLVELVSDRIVYQHARRHSTALLPLFADDRFDVIEVIRLLILRSDVNVNAEYGRGHNSPLQAATHQGRVEYIQLLLDKGADVNAQGGEYGTALRAAAYKGSREVVQLLLDKGADINAQVGEYGTALQAAAYKGGREIVQLLLDKGADVHAQGGMYGTALQAAAAMRHGIEVVPLLLDKGADVNAQGGKYGTALQAAATYNGSREVVQLLLDRGADVNAQGGEYGTALQAAVCEGSGEIVQLLLDRGADVNAQVGKYGTALQAAADQRDRFVRWLLNQGADINAQGGEYGTALLAATYNGSREVVQLLLDRGADVNAQGGKYGTALQVAAGVYKGSREVVQLLLDRGADVNAQGGKYGTALQAAMGKGSREIVQLLLDRGADVHAQGGEYGTALQAAAYQGGREIVRLLLDKGADVHAQGGMYGTTLQAAAAMFKGIETVQLLLDMGADVNAQSGVYGTALQAAAAMWHGIEVVRLLLDKGADVNAQGGKYGTALQAAAAVYKGTDTEIVQLLLDRGADVNAQGGEYGTALQAAVYEGSEEIVQLLLDRGADVNAQGGKYGTAVQIAAPGCQLRVMESLLGRGADVDARGGRYGTALQATIASIPDNDFYLHFRATEEIKGPPIAVLKLLLAHGADVTAHVEGSEYGDALTAAKHVYKNDQETLDWLVKYLESRGQVETV